MDAALGSRWLRLWVPSLTDLLFVAVLAACLRGVGGGTGAGLLFDADIGWHTRTGEYILRHRAVPHHDLYSFSRAGAPWFAWEWLADVVFACAHLVAGLKGVVLLSAVLLSLFVVTLVRRMLARDAHVGIVLIMGYLAVSASQIHFHARPHIFTLLLLSLAMALIERDRERPSARIWWLVPLAALWTNLHGGFMALIALLGLAAAGSLFEGWLAQPRTMHAAARYAKLTLACGLASLLNPYGWKLHTHIVTYLRSSWIRDNVREFSAPTFRGAGMLQFELLLGLGLIVAGAALRRRRFVEALWLVFWGHMALVSARHIPVFAAVCTPLLAWSLSTSLRGWLHGVRRPVVLRIERMADNWRSLGRHTSLLPWLVVVALASDQLPLRWAQDFPQPRFPSQLAHEHAALIARSRVLTTDQWADYLIYTNPELKLFFDGRSDFFGETLGRRYLQLMTGDWRWRKWLDYYAFDLALLPLPNALAELLKGEREWHVRVDTGRQIMFVRDPR